MAKSPDRPAAAADGWFAPLRDPLRGVCLLIIGTSLCVSFARLMSVEPLQSANDRARWCTVWSLNNGDGYVIDNAIRRPGWDTIDKVLHEGHFHSTKPPLLSTLVAGLYWLERATLGWTLDEQTAATVRLLLVFMNLLPWGAAVWMLSEIVRRSTSSHVTLLVITAVAAWGTLLTPFLSTFNNHVPAAICLIFALDAATRITIDGDTRWWRYALCGLFAALTTTFELPAAAFGLAIFLLLFRQSKSQALTHFLPFAAIPLVAFFVTNLLDAGGLRPFYMFYGGDKYVYTHEGIPSYWSEPRGIDRASDSVATYLLHCTIGHHGILSLSPILLLAIAGWVLALRSENRLRSYLALGAGLTGVVLAYFLTRTANYNYGGNTVALRWMLWLVPFWLLAMIPVLDRFGERRWFRVTATVLFAASVFSAWYPLGSPWQSPWLMTWMQNRGWIDYRDPPPAIQHTVYSWLYQLPSGPQNSNYWIELSSVDADGVLSIIRVEDGGPVLVNQREARVVRILRRSGSGQQSELMLTVDAVAFRSGEPIDRWLLWQQRDPGVNYRRLVARLLSGLPEPVPFTIHSKVYRQSRIRRDAFECLTASARTVQPSYNPEWESRLFEARLILSPEVPFGVLRFETYVYDASGGTLHAQRRWAIHRCGMYLPRPGTEPAYDPSAATTSASGPTLMR
ncbi:MAG: hypothetical protein ACK5Q5_07275 [Planctomycetaceae bacterium]